MNRESFERRHGATWRRFELLLDDLEARRADSRLASELPQLHRRVCHHLALARRRHLGADLEERLNRLARRGHNQLYRGRLGSVQRIVEFLLAGFPRLVRSQARLFWLSSLLLYGPAVAMYALVTADPESIYSVMSDGQIQHMEEMYSPGSQDGRDAATDFEMFGFYIANNIGVGFRTFALGLLAGLGTVMVLTYNGLILGGIGAHLTHAGHGEAFWSFVVTHGAPELTAIVIAGVAGLRLGLAILAPGRWTRARALREASAVALPLILGVAALLVLAAVIEAFWSSSTAISSQTKAASGLTAWLAVAAYLVLFGRRHAA